MIDAGLLLRQLREEKGMSIEAMASALKVSAQKLKALEEGQMNAFPNTAFVRALAMSVCKVLKVDHAEVLARMPLPDTSNLKVDTQNQQPFKENGTRLSLHNTTLDFFVRWAKPKYLLPIFILLAALFVYWWPSQPSSNSQSPQQRNAQPQPQPQPESTVNTVVDQASAYSTSSQTPAVLENAAESTTVQAQTGNDTPSPSASVEAMTATETAATDGSAVAQQGEVKLVAKSESWVRIKDAEGALLIRRLVFPGEQITLAGKLPFRVTVGNVAAVDLQYQGKNIDLSDHARGSVARLDLK